MQLPELKKPIPAQVINERAAYGPFDLKEYIQAPDESELVFSAELKSGESLPKGMICTADGILTGIPAKGTEGNYELVITAENEAGSIQVPLMFAIKPSLTTPPAEYFDKLKSQIWEALEQKLPIPDLGEMYLQEITPMEVYYLLERWGTLTIWDAFNLDPPSEKIQLNLEGASKHFNVYDRGSCLIACPKDLFSYERTMEDALKTARAMAREVYKRGWTIEMAGYTKLTRAAWIEIQHLSDEYGKKLDVINYTPSLEDIKLYNTQAVEMRIESKPE